MLCRNFKGKINRIYNLGTLLKKIKPVRSNGQGVSVLSSHSAGVSPVVSIVWLLNQLIGLVPKGRLHLCCIASKWTLSRNKYQMHCTGKEDFTDIWIILNSCNIFLYFWKDYMNSAPYNTCVSSIGSYCKILW